MISANISTKPTSTPRLGSDFSFGRVLGRALPKSHYLAGKSWIRQSQKAQLARGEISQFIYDFNSHAHNQFLDEMAKRGIVGLGALLLMMLIPYSW